MRLAGKGGLSQIPNYMIALNIQYFLVQIQGDFFRGFFMAGKQAKFYPNEKFDKSSTI
jgi:hypothetical protein